MSPKEFQKSHLTIELRAGIKRLEGALHGLSDEQCEKAGATRSGSAVDLLSEIVTKEFVALMEITGRLPSLPTNLFANADGRTTTASGTEKASADKSVATRTALLFFDVEEFTTAESAKILGINTSALKSRVRRARRRLAQSLQGRGM
jgi:DNA-directed RNA polymerase specialized sigma24 family protein